MRFDAAGAWARLSNSWRISIGAMLWLILITTLHFCLNFQSTPRKIVKMGYMPVISNLAAPILDHVTKNGNGVRFEALKFSSFAEMAEALRNGHIQAAFIIAPLAIVLRQQGEDVKIVCIGNRHESTLVVSSNKPVSRFEDLAGLTVAVPIRYSGHYLCLQKLMEEFGMRGKINIVEMNPPDMASALTVGSLDGYFVGEPFAAKTVKSGHSRVLLYVEDVWPDFICNLMVVRGDLIKKDPESVRLLVQSAARACAWAARNTSSAAAIASKYWNQPIDLVEYALSHPPGRIQYSHFIPDVHQLHELASLMVRFGLSKDDDVSGLVEARFAQDADLKGIGDVDTILAR